MCRIAWNEGIRSVAATAHMSDRWPEVTRPQILRRTQELAARLQEIQLPLNVYPSAEVEIRPDLDHAWASGEIVGVADRRRYLLIEFPAGVFFDIRDLVRCLRSLGVRAILAHPERQAELLFDSSAIEELIALGCLVQVSADSITEPASAASARALRAWVRRGIVHLIGSDGHSPVRRPPHLAKAYQQIASWAGGPVADRICGHYGLAVLDGRELHLPSPTPVRKKWFTFFR